ncbi:hypothetical protein [Longitalea arenae]|uniref:hypothetical protein n=1 Tax=Longitalea arenae TaxID=2812558 RepID=UPI0019686339|nr:hypothetical protein [Longitalea arenae]
MIKNANDRTTYMAELGRCLEKLSAKGFNDQYKVIEDKLYCLTSGHTFNPEDIKAVNFYRFEGVSNPDDMAILYAIETNDGRRGTLIDAYGFYADTQLGDFMKKVEIHKKVTDEIL